MTTTRLLVLKLGLHGGAQRGDTNSQDAGGQMVSAVPDQIHATRSKTRRLTCQADKNEILGRGRKGLRSLAFAGPRAGT